MEAGSIASEIWTSFLFLVASLTFWLHILGAFAVAYLVAFVVSRLRIRTVAPTTAAYEGLVWGFWVAFLLVGAAMYFLWQPDYVALALALLIVVVIPWTVIAALKARVDGTEA